MGKNVRGTLLASAARTTTTSSSDQTNNYCKGVRVFINATALAATPSVVPTIEVKDPVSGTYTAILTGAAITTAAPTHVVLTCYPGATVAANLTASIPIGKVWRLTMTAGDADSLTYSAAYEMIV